MSGCNLHWLENVGSAQDILSRLAVGIHFPPPWALATPHSHPYFSFVTPDNR